MWPRGNRRGHSEPRVHRIGALIRLKETQIATKQVAQNTHSTIHIIHPRFSSVGGRIWRQTRFRHRSAENRQLISSPSSHPITVSRSTCSNAMDSRLPEPTARGAKERGWTRRGSLPTQLWSTAGSIAFECPLARLSDLVTVLAGKSVERVVSESLKSFSLLIQSAKSPLPGRAAQRTASRGGELHALLLLAPWPSGNVV